MNTAEREKKKAALSSVLAAVFLTGMKLVVGLMSGSLGILAEAAHSGLDLVAALVTFFAVRVSSKPADREHHYGHGKVENLSALFESLLLLATCLWIMVEAVQRLAAKEVHVNASIWTFAVILISIFVDISRSRMLRRVALKYKSQALEADALHFSTDIWSSAVVLFGLVGVKIAGLVPGMEYLVKADAIAALVVALIVIWVCGSLGMRTIRELLDTAPKEMAEKIKGIAEAVDNVQDCHHVRVRSSGPEIFIDAHITVEGSQTLNEAHLLTDKVEDAIRREIPGADVTIHAEPPEGNVGKR